MTSSNNWDIHRFGDSKIPTQGGVEKAAKSLIFTHPDLRVQKSRIYKFPGAAVSNFAILPPMGDFPGMWLTEKGRLVKPTLDFLKRVQTDCVKHAFKGHKAGLLLGLGGYEPPEALGGLQCVMSHATEFTLPPLQVNAKKDDWRNPLDREIFDELIRLFLNKPTLVSYSHPGHGTGSAPRWESTKSQKMESISRYLGNLHLIRDGISSGKWLELDREYGVFNLTFLQSRRQPESPVKQRQLITWDTYQTGRVHTADKSLSKEGLSSWWGKARLRLVYATSSSMNWTFGSYQLYPFLAGFLEEYSSTFKVRGTEDLSSRIATHHPISVDVSSFDQHMPSCFQESMFDALRDRLGDEWTYPIFASFYSPLMFPPSKDFDSKPLMLGNPYEGPWPYQRGLPSGHSLNVPLGRLAGVFLQVVALFDLGILSDVGSLRELLKGENERVKILNSSDDCVFLLRDREDVNLIQDYFSGNRHPYYDVNVDPYFSYLGMLVYEDGKVRRSSLKGSSYLVNLLAPERSAGGRMRRFPWTGFKSRDQLYAEEGSVASDLVMESFRRCFKDQYSYDWDELVEEGYKTEVLKSSSLYHLSRDDLEYLANPDSVHYKVDINDVNPSLRDDLTLTIPARVLERYYPHVYR